MSDFSKRVAALSPQQRALLDRLLAEKGKPASPAQSVPRRPDGSACPLSFAQERLWFLDQFTPNSPLYNESVAFRLTGALHLDALRASFDAIVARHEVLRTTFQTAQEQPVQVIAPQLRLALPLIDLAAASAAEREAEAQRVMLAEAQQPFDLQRGPLLRVTLLRLDQQKHIVLLVVHHSVFDRWSAGVLVQELGALYGAFAEGQPSPLPDLRIQYADWALWQREWLAPGPSGSVHQRQLDYWRQRLAAAPPVLELPTDYPRPSVQHNRGARQERRLPVELGTRLRELSQREGVTLFMTLLAAWQTLLYRYTGETDLVVGTRIAGRTQVETERLIGLFLNALVLRTSLAGNPTFRELLQRVRETALEAYAHQDIPFEQIVEVLQPERALSHQPLFQVMFALQNTPLPTLELPGLTLHPLKIDSATAKLDLDFWVIEDGDILTGVLEYNTDLFAAETIKRMLGQIETLLTGFVANPEQRIATAPLLSQAELHELLVARSGSHTPYPQQCMHELFEDQVARTPDALAMSYRAAHLTYHELNQRANQLARHLRSLGIGGPALGNAPVGVCAERSLTTVVALLAILKAGGAYVPLDPAYPQTHLAFVANDTRAPIVLTEQRLRERLPTLQATIVDLDADWPTIAQHDAANLPSASTPDHIFYIMYTSGSTGQPKGVVVAQRQLLNRFAWMWRAYPFAADEVACQRTTVNFTVSIWELLGPLLRGIRTVIMPDEVVQDAPAFVQALGAQEITRIVLVPSLLQAILDTDLDLQHHLMRLKLWSVCGEALSRELWQRFRERLPDAILLNQYGASEVNDATWFDTRNWSGAQAAVPIGRPIDNLRIDLLDHNMQPVPLGVPGDVYISGVSLAHGYLDQPALTAEKFVPDPFSPPEDGGVGRRLYSMGDRARWLPDGNLEYLGRRDQQVKVRGVRIEPGGIETLLRRHPAVAQAVVLVREDNAQQQLVAYVVGEESRTQNQEPRSGTADSQLSAPGSASELRAYLREHLPEHTLPTAFVLLPALPRTPNGKVDRRALPAPAEVWASDEALPQRAAYVAPRTPVEELLAGIWSAVLHIERVGVHDNFFELGGHSLLATQVVSRTREALQVTLPLRALFEAPTVAGLTERIRAEQTTATLQSPPLLPADRAQNLPLSFAQQRLWFLDQLEPGNPFYNVPAAVRLSGALDVAALERSLQAVVRRHAVLRTTFALVDRQPVQVIVPELAVQLPVVDLGHLSSATREADVQRLADDEARRPFDLQAGPLLRIKLLRLDQHEHVLLLNVHHIVSDGWSTQVLVREVVALYAAFSDPTRQDGSDPLPPLAIQYADWALWQRQWLTGTALEQQLAYWRRQLAAVPVLELPTDRPRPAVQVFQGARATRELPSDLTHALRTLSQREGVTMFMTLLAAFQTLLGRYSSQDDIIVGAPIAGRTRPETEGLIGFFVNTLVLRGNLSGRPTFRALLGRVRETCLQAYAHQDVPFEKLVEELHPERDLSRHPFFDVLFNFLDSSQLVLESPGLMLRSIQTEPESKFAITLYIDERGGDIGLRLVYQRALFSAERMATLLDQFQYLLEQIVAAPESPLDALSLVTPATRALLPDPSVPLDEPVYPLVTELVAGWAARMPDHPALRQHDQTQSYATFVEHARNLARELLAQRLERRQVVIVAGPRSFGLITSMLATMLGGGVMLTLDRNLPAQRQRLMVEVARGAFCLYVGDWRAEDDWLRELPELRIIAVNLDGTPVQPRADHSAPRALPALTPDDHAYIFFTSGTTGVPKGVLGWHKGLSHFVIWQRDTFAISPDDRSAQLTGLSFNVLLRDVFTPLISGATVCLPPADADLGPDHVLPWMEREGITLLHTVPTLAQSWLIRPPAQVTLRTLRWVFSAGEPLTEALVQRWRATFPQSSAAIVLLYGQTETTLAKCFYQVPATIEPGVQPAGRTLPHTQALVLSASGQLCGIGEPGEVVFRTPFRTLGYFNAPDEQQQRFRQNPFVPAANQRDLLYFTGDRGRYRADGTLLLLGRADDQVKIRGIRVEPAEVQAWLGRHPAVNAAVVLVQPEPQTGEQRLVAYVATGETQPDPTLRAELRGFLRQQLPETMVPAVFVLLSALPLNANGKVDRQALPQPDAQTESDHAKNFVAPRTAVEQQIAAVWSSILEREPIGIHDNFFELGGHSLLGTQLLTRLRETFQVELSLRALFETPTIIGLARMVEQARTSSTPSTSRTPTISRLARDRHRVQAATPGRLTLPDGLKSTKNDEDS